MLVLGIETSCDETAAAVYDSAAGLLSNIISTQTIHTQHGGVVPELASRDHNKNLPKIIQQAIKNAGIQQQDLDAIAYTAGSGLAGCLMVGAATAKSYGLGLNIPTIATNHLEAHILAPFIEHQDLSFPFLALLVSGGHSQLIHAKALGKYTILGQSLDDAVGEAFDKVAKMLGLPYPGGALLAKLATTGEPVFDFPQPLAKQNNLNFSFSGLKTAVFYTLQDYKKYNKTLTQQDKANIAASFEQSAINSLITKTTTALQTTKLKKLVIAGGVSANSYLRTKINQLPEQLQDTQLRTYFASTNLCTDNAAMIAYTGCQYLLNNQQDKNLKINIIPRWSVEDINYAN